MTDWAVVFDEVEKSNTVGALDLIGITREVTGGAFHQRPHLDALCALLEQAVADVANGQSRRIVVSLPPGLGKSMTCSVSLPLYILARHPTWNLATISAEASLATKFSRDTKRYAEEFGYDLAPDLGQVMEWGMKSGGSMLARGVGGALTGRRLTCLLIDDPVKDAKAAYSEVERDSLWSWYQSVARTRMAPASLSLLVMTRWHEADLAAKLLEQGWEEFRLPALAETEDPLGREPGEPLLTPQADETPEIALARWRNEREEVGEYSWAGLYQQRPAPAGGAVFNVDDLLELDGPVDLDLGTWVTSWDLGFGTTDKKRREKTDYTVGTVWQSLPDGRYILHDLVRGRWQFTEQLAMMRRTIDRYPQCTRHLVEAAANGAAVIDTMQRDSPGVDKIPGVTPVKPLGGKMERWEACTPLLEAHKVYHVGGSWIDDLVGEMAVAPNGKHDDQLDSLAQALNWLRVKRAKKGEVGNSAIKQRLPGW